MRQDNPLQIRAIRQHAHTVTGARQDYRPLMELIGNSRFVLLGEASHGTHDFYHTRTQITKWLIEEKGFSAVAVETDWPDAHRVNRYVRGGDEDAEAVEALGSFKRFPTWIWRNTDVVEFVDWLRQHFWRYTPDEYGWIDDSMSGLRRDFLPEHLEPELKRAGFDGSIAVQARQTLEETRWLLDLATSSPFILGVIGWVDLRASNVQTQLARFAGNPKLLGIRHVVQSEPDERFLLQPEFLRGISALAEFDLTYDLLIYPRHLSVAAEFVRRFPRQRFALDHLAKPLIKTGTLQPWDADIRKLAQFPNVFCKLSGLITEADWKTWKPEHIAPYLDVALECFGPDRLMIGSDWPVCTVAGSYAQVMNLVLDSFSKYPEDLRNAVLGGNAEKFWRLAPVSGEFC